jgi:ABC-type glycerol-3-phosphate transport system substrate-binding protein
MNRLIAKSLGAAALLTLAAAGARADDVILNHDKNFWSEQLQAVGDLCGEQTGVRIVQQAYSPPDQYKAFIQSSIASGSTPDMFTWWSGATFRDDLVATGQIATLDDIWADMLASGEFTADSGEPFKIDGHYYAVPLHFNRWVMFYNPELFAKAGVAEPKTWDELMAAADKLKAAGITPFVSTNQDGWRGFIWFEELMIRTNPKAYLGLFDGTTAYDGPEVHKVFEIWSDLYAKGYFSDPRSNQEVQDFASGKGAMDLMGEWAIGLMTDAGMQIGKDLDAFVVPNIDAGLGSGMVFEASPLVISVAGKEKPDVVTALKCWVSAPAAAKWGEVSGNFMGNVKATAPSAIVSKISDVIAAEHSTLYPRWWEAVPAELQGESVAELNSFMLDPTMETAEKVMANIEALHKQYWADHQE